jgi:hypothetical protein
VQISLRLNVGLIKKQPARKLAVLFIVFDMPRLLEADLNKTSLPITFDQHKHAFALI